MPFMYMGENAGLKKGGPGSYILAHLANAKPMRDPLT